MKAEKLLLVSTNENTRLCVIENCIFIEETISKTIGTLLGIDWEYSKSLGSSSSSLSFNQKVHIIMDLKGIDKEDHKRFLTLMSIRNQFAHNSKIISFNDVFAKAKNGNELKNNFNKWYFDKKGMSDIPDKRHEQIYRLCFYLLIHRLTEVLLKLSGDHMYLLGVAEGERQANEKLKNELLVYLKTLDNGQEIIEDIRKKLLEEIEGN